MEPFLADPTKTKKCKEASENINLTMVNSYMYITWGSPLATQKSSRLLPKKVRLFPLLEIKDIMDLLSIKD